LKQWSDGTHSDMVMYLWKPQAEQTVACTGNV